MSQQPSPKLPPQNIEAEEALLGSLLIDQDAFFDVGNFLKPEMFFAQKNRWVYEAILDIQVNNNPLDIITLSEVLRRRGHFDDIGNEAYLTGLIGSVANSINCESYGRIVEAAYIRRQLLKSAGNIAKLAYDESIPVSDALDKSGSELFKISAESSSKDASRVEDVARKYLDKLEELYRQDKPIVGISTGLNDLDNLTSGLNKSDLIILAARPGMGKTSLQNGIALHAALKEGKKVAMFNMEMSEEQLVQRMLSRQTGVDIQRLRRGQLEDHEWLKVHEFTSGIANIMIDDTPSLSPVQLRTKCRKIHAEYGLDLIVIDYLQLMIGDKDHGANRVNEVSEISRGLKLLARELNVPVLASAQLSRSVESRMDKRPILSDLRDSGALEQDSDIVMFIYRDEYYNPETTDRPNVAELNIAKHRNGATAVIDLYWNGQTASFANLQRQKVEW